MLYLCAGIENELAVERQRFSQLKADFDYNLSLLSQRDEELSRYEEMFAGVRRVLNSMMAENSQLKVCAGRGLGGSHCSLNKGNYV